MKIMVSGPFTSWQIDGETTETVTDHFLGLQNHYRYYCSHEIKRRLLLARKIIWPPDEKKLLIGKDPDA